MSAASSSAVSRPSPSESAFENISDDRSSCRDNKAPIVTAVKFSPPPPPPPMARAGPELPGGGMFCPMDRNSSDESWPSALTSALANIACCSCCSRDEPPVLMEVMEGLQARRRRHKPVPAPLRTVPERSAHSQNRALYPSGDKPGYFPTNPLTSA